MSKIAFDAFLKRQQDEAAAEQVAGLDPAQQLQEWLKHLNSLYTQIEKYLCTYVENNAAKISRRDIELNEEFIGAYSAPELILTISRSTVTFTPIGTMLIGTKGRVDVKGPRGGMRLALVNEQISNAQQLISMAVTSVGGQATDPPNKQSVKQNKLVWKISTPPPEMKFIGLKQDTFFDMILAVINDQ